jgi:hypothetical protein
VQRALGCYPTGLLKDQHRDQGGALVHQSVTGRKLLGLRRQRQTPGVPESLGLHFWGLPYGPSQSPALRLIPSAFPTAS